MTSSPDPEKYPWNNTGQQCIVFPPKVNSVGIWDYIPRGAGVFTGSLQILEFEIILVLAFSHVIHSYLKNMGVQLFISQMITGIILGPSMLGHIPAIKYFLFPEGSNAQVFNTVASFGLVMFIFLMGVKTNPRSALTAGKQSVIIGLSATIIPLIPSLFFLFSPKPESPVDAGVLQEHVAIVATQSLTPLAVIAYLLSELKILNSDLGRLALSTAVICQFCDLAIMGTIGCYSAEGRKNTAGMTVYVVFVFSVVRPIMHWMIRRNPEGQPAKEWNILATVMLAFASAYYFSLFDQPVTMGALLFGLAVPEGPPLGSALEEKFGCFITGIFLPLFVASVTMRVPPFVLFIEFHSAKFALRVIFFSFFTRMIGCLIPCFLFKMHWKDSLALSLILSSKGVVEACSYVFFLDRSIVSEGVFAAGILGIFLNSSFVPIIVKSLYDSISKRYAGYEERNILNLKQNSELKILVCVHGSDDVPPLINLLSATNPTKESPTCVYVLHLIELVGSTSHVFIAHQGREKGQLTNSYEDVVLAFNRFEQINRGLVTVNAFTAISPLKLMHQDVFTLAFDKQASFILLPFHRKWSIGGMIESECSATRNLNRSVLERTPCSVGILVHRPTTNQTMSGNLSGQSLNVCMMFFGGRDDREALALVNRMAKDPNEVILTVIHFISKEENRSQDMNWDTILDAEEMKHIKDNINVFYKEELVQDGPETALIIRELVNGYHLIVVGRRYGLECVQTSGLSDWSEFPELGIIGDFLASTDLDCRASTLIVQQQNSIDVHHVEQQTSSRVQGY